MSLRVYNTVRSPSPWGMAMYVLDVTVLTLIKNERLASMAE